MRRAQIRLWLEPLERRTVPATYTVTNVNDFGAGSLRQAVSDANGFFGADTISFDENGAFANPQTILLTSGQLSLMDAVNIIGPAARVTIDGNNANRIFNVDVPTKSGHAVSISGMALTRGKVSGNFDGGAIFD